MASARHHCSIEASGTRGAARRAIRCVTSGQIRSKGQGDRLAGERGGVERGVDGLSYAVDSKEYSELLDRDVVTYMIGRGYHLTGHYTYHSKSNSNR